MVGLGIYGYQNGDSHHLIAPVDADLNLCGITEGYEGYKKLYITDFSALSISGIFDSGVCVESCPTEEPVTLNCAKNTKVTSCEVSGESAYLTRSVLDFCVPANSDEVP